MGAWIAQRFTNPATLWLLPLVAVPILIWLLNRFRYRTVDWAAMEFLLRAMRKNRRRVQLENLLLLLLRCLVVLLFVLALARPRAPTSPAGLAADEEGRARRNVIIVMDSSWSMGYQQGVETVFERAQIVAIDILRSLRAGDRVVLVSASDGANPIHASPRTLDEQGHVTLVHDLDEIRLTSRTGDISAVLRQLPALCRRFDPSEADGSNAAIQQPKTIYLITDAQRRAWLDDDSALRDPAMAGMLSDLEAANAELVVVDVSAADRANVGIVGIGIPESVVAEFVPVRFEVRVRNWSNKPVDGLQLEYYVDDIPEVGNEPSPRLTSSVHLEPNEERVFANFIHAFEGLGLHRVQVRLISDSLPADNTRSLVLDVRESVNVLLLDGQPSSFAWESETDFLRQSLAPQLEDDFDEGALFQATVRNDHELPELALEDYDIVVLANLATPAMEEVTRLERYVRDGGSLVIYLGDNVEPVDYNARLWRGGEGLLPVELGEPAGLGRSVLSPGDRDRPVWIMTLDGPSQGPLAVMHDEELRPLLREADFFRFFTCHTTGETPEDSGPQPLVRARFVRRPADEIPGTVTSVAEPELGIGHPAIIERVFGRGRVILNTSTADAQWNSLCLRFAGPIMVPSLMSWLAQDQSEQRNLPVGHQFEASIPPEMFVPRVEIRLPSGDEVDEPLSRLDEGRRFQLEFDDTEQPGIYVLTFNTPGQAESRESTPDSPAPSQPEDTPAPSQPEEPRTTYFAINVDPLEGDLAKVHQEDLEGLLGGVKLSWAKPAELSSLLSGPGRAATGSEWWFPLVVGVLVLLLLESMAGMLFERLRQ